ncbi:protein of unknown function [Methylocella tundrae]|uniref:HTH tetR-type domain-containing protein n=1 Tax=Methylocella tundrae TaxID=227605 RepID=A0A4U8Z2X3_METTU|nr:protein of unknown function [Methylocella tundrae]
MFQEKGFAEATLDDVIALSGGSRQTLYLLFWRQEGPSRGAHHRDRRDDFPRPHP